MSCVHRKGHQMQDAADAGLIIKEIKAVLEGEFNPFVPSAALRNFHCYVLFTLGEPSRGFPYCFKFTWKGT